MLTKQTGRDAVRRLITALALALTVLALVALACGPTSPAGQNAMPEPTATADPTSTPTLEPTATAEPTDTSEPTATATSEPVNSEPCRAVIKELGVPVAPYRFGPPSAASGDRASRSPSPPEPTITVDLLGTFEGAINPSLTPPTIENMTPYHDFIVRGVAGTRTDLVHTHKHRDYKFVFGYVNFRVSKYLKGSGPEFICIYDHPEYEPFRILHEEQEYILMLLHSKTRYYNGDEYPAGAYESTEMGWSVDGDEAVQFVRLPDQHNFVITSDQREIYTIWLTPEPQRVWPEGEHIPLTTLEHRIKAAHAKEAN